MNAIRSCPTSTSHVHLWPCLCFMYEQLQGERNASTKHTYLLPTLATNTCYQNLLPILCQHFLDGHQQINRVGHNHILNTYIQCIYGLFIREITIQTAIYGVYIRFWPTLQIKHASTPTQEWLDPSKQKQGDTKEGFYVGCDFTPDVPEISKPIHGRNQVCSDCGGVASNSKHGQNQASMQGLR